MPAVIHHYSLGHHTFRKPPTVPLPFWLDGSSKDFLVETHPRGDNQADVRETPGHSGHAGSYGQAERVSSMLPQRVKCRSSDVLMYRNQVH